MTEHQNHLNGHHRTDEELKKLFKEIFTEEIKQMFVICQESTSTFSETHKLEHDYIKAMIEREKLKMNFYRDVTKQLVGWGVIALVGSIGAWVWNHLMMSR